MSILLFGFIFRVSWRPFLFYLRIVRDNYLVIHRVVFRGYQLVQMKLPEEPLVESDLLIDIVQISVDVIPVTAVMVKEIVKL